MTFEVCLCVPSGDEHLQYSWRFLDSYLRCPAQCDHDLILLTDPGYEQEALELFEIVPKVRAMATPDYAKDLSRYEFHCKQSTAELVLYLGGSSYLRRPGWGLVAVRAFQSLGSQNLFGACGHGGAPGVEKHLRSTGMWGSPRLFSRYPGWPKNAGGRYAAEHSPQSISTWVRQQGGQCWVINFGSQHTLEHANDDPQGYARGSQQSLIFGDRLTMPPYQPFA
jgi:hypothetical protein